MNYQTSTIAGVARAAMLVDLQVSIYSGRKQDKQTQAEVTNAKGANSKKAASVYKSLFADCSELDAITKFQARARADHYKYTKPWNDYGARLLPTAVLQTYKQAMNKHQIEFDRLVQAFLIKYDTLVASMAFQLGSLFDRDEYPTSAKVAQKFRMDISFSPLPTAGDFRLDIESEVQQDIVKQYEKRLESQLEAVAQDSWSKLHEALLRLSDRLVVEEDGTKRKFHDTMVTGALELCELLTQMNITQDPALEKARRKVEEVLSGVTPKELREEDSTRIFTKQKVDEILGAFDWGDTEGEV
jgi:hypothetical protein